MERIYFKAGEAVRRFDRLSLLLGNFDGVHRGHASLVEEAKRKGEGPIGVLLFSRNPAEYIGEAKSKRSLSDLETKIALFAQLGVEVFYIVESDRDFFSLSKEAFMEKVIDEIDPSLIVVGEDYRFGFMGQGEVKDLKERYNLACCPLLANSEGEKISTRRIISLLNEGKVKEANRMLGRSYEVKGTVMKGFGNGRNIGFPTANLKMDEGTVYPKVGVYKAIAYNRGIPYLAIVNVGSNPTLGLLERPIIEAYLKGLGREIYGETLYIDFIDRIRDEAKFASLDELKEQLNKDIGSWEEALR